MMMNDAITEYMRRNLKPSRFEHCLRVSRLCGELADRYSCDREIAVKAGMFHDCAREMSISDFKIWAQRSPVRSPDPYEETHPVLLHSLAGSALLYHKFGIDNDILLGAVANHTLGSPGMDHISSIVYIADYMEPGRKYHKNIPEELKNSGIPLKSLLKSVLELCITHVREKGGVPAQRSLELLQELNNGI